MTSKLETSRRPDTAVTTTTATTHANNHPLISEARGWTGRTWALLLVLCGALFLDALDISMVGVALPSIGADLGMDPTALQWIVSGYVLGYGGLLLLGGRASDLLGRRRVFLAAVLVFGVASVVTAVLSNDLAIIALRFVKGVAAAFTVPAGLSIITTTFAEGPARNRALSIYTVSGASGFSLGLVFGGVLTELGWRATFLLPGPVALAIAAVAWRVVPRAAVPSFRLRDFDLLGAVTVTGALLLTVFTVVEAPGRGWASATTLGSAAVALGLLVAFVVTELRHPAPLVRLGILRSPSLVHANVAGAVMFGCYAAFQFLVTLFLQDTLGWSPLSMALAFLPAGVLVAASSLHVDKLLAVVRTEVLIATGLTAFFAAYVLFFRVGLDLSYAAVLLPTMLLLGVGFAIAFPSINAQATAGVADDEQGLASGLVNTSVQVGGAIMMAVVTAVLGSHAGAPGATGAAEAAGALAGLHAGLQVIVGLTVVGVLVSALMLYRGRRPRLALD
jgi:MFS family permease